MPVTIATGNLRGDQNRPLLNVQFEPRAHALGVEERLALPNLLDVDTDIAHAIARVSRPRHL